MRRATAIAVVAFAFSSAPANATNGHCRDDMPCWNWRTMGNHQRGIVTLGGRALVVGPVRFDRLNRALRIDWARTPKLKGDGERFDVQDY